MDIYALENVKSECCVEEQLRTHDAAMPAAVTNGHSHLNACDDVSVHSGQ